MAEMRVRARSSTPVRAAIAAPPAVAIAPGALPSASALDSIGFG